jgi:hypothetical protein
MDELQERLAEEADWPEPRDDPPEEPFEPWAREHDERDWPWRHREDD